MSPDPVVVWSPDHATSSTAGLPAPRTADDALIELLAEHIAAEAVGRGEFSGDAGRALRQKPRDLELWPA
jgi:hypothetical protein